MIIQPIYYATIINRMTSNENGIMFMVICDILWHLSKFYSACILPRIGRAIQGIGAMVQDSCAIKSIG